ncbi:MAG: HEAT repeat domain-containing protein [Planctomycetes bacterium]|nr:HEAT repeat domain-containing protein [Planctomycetota bacterium]
MEKGTTTAVFCTLLGLAAGVGGMYLFGPNRDAQGDLAAAERRVGALQAELDEARLGREKAAREAEDARKERERTLNAGGDMAAELGRVADDKAELQAKAREYKDKYDTLKAGSDEALRQKNARVEQLEKLLEDNGILSHFSPEEIARRIESGKAEFERAFATKDKKAAIAALWDLQKLGPAAYDDAIAMWKQVAADFGLNPFGQGPNTLGLNFQEYTSLITTYGLVHKGLTDPNVDQGFRISSLYGLAWWTSEPAADRARLAGDILLASKGYESTVAITALNDIPDPASVRYLTDYLSTNTDNAGARKQAVTSLAGKDTPEAWAAIEHAAANDPDPEVRKAAGQQMAARNATVEGVMITFVAQDGQGALAGIQVGDIMTRYNGVAVKNLQDVNAAKGGVAEGQSVQVLVRRGNEDLSLTIGPGSIGINGIAVIPKQ